MYVLDEQGAEYGLREALEQSLAAVTKKTPAKASVPATRKRA